MPNVQKKHVSGKRRFGLDGMCKGVITFINPALVDENHKIGEMRAMDAKLDAIARRLADPPVFRSSSCT